MASSTRHLCRCLRLVPRSSRMQRISSPWFNNQHVRLFSCTLRDRALDGIPTNQSKLPQRPGDPTLQTKTSTKSNEADILDETEYLTPAEPLTVNDLSPQQRADYEVLSKAERGDYLRMQNHMKALFESEETQADMDAMVDQADRDIDRMGPQYSIDFPTTRATKRQLGYWGTDDDDEFAQWEDGDDEFSEEHISSMAESELDLHRDIREYTRITAWELPLLQQYAKPFQPPNHATPLRFRYTTYMGETHPAQSKVVVELCTKDLTSHPSSTYKINEAQRSKLIKLAGVRYNPDTDVIKMSSEKFETAAQNKRYLGELVGKLIKEAKDKRDEFKDVPFDFRHHKPKQVIKFPEQWKLNSSEKVKQLAMQREEQKLLPEEDLPVDGDKLVAQYVRVGATQPTAQIR